MLIRFFVENFLSFNELTEFSMVAGQGTSLAHHIVKSPKRGVPNVLRAALLYGANGSGKSNFVKAIAFAQKFIGSGVLKEEMIGVKPFRLQRENLHKPSKFQFDIKLKDNVYAYGFSIDGYSVKEEYLYLLGENNEKTIFHRVTTSEGKVQISFDNIVFENAEEEQFMKFTGKGCPQNRLFLTECNQRNVWENVQHIKNIRQAWIQLIFNLFIMFPEEYLSFYQMQKEKYEELSNYFNTGISQLIYEDIDFDAATMELDEGRVRQVNNLKNERTILVKSANKNHLFLFDKKEEEMKAYKILSHHLDNSTSTFEFSEESDGTKRLFDFFPIISTKNSSTFIIDEIDRSLHPHLSRSILAYFLENQKGTEMQLIATTHESSLLDLDLLRKDEIWFSEKNTKGATELYSLEEFKPRADKEIRKGYLQGRYGAIPFIGNLKTH